MEGIGEAVKRHRGGVLMGLEKREREREGLGEKEKMGGLGFGERVRREGKG